MNRKILAFLFCFWMFGYHSFADEHSDKFNLADPGYQISFKE